MPEIVCIAFILICVCALTEQFMQGTRRVDDPHLDAPVDEEKL